MKLTSERTILGTCVLVFLVYVALGSGCGQSPTHSQSREVKPTPLGQHFDVSRTGTIRGRVQWEGDLPVVEELISAKNPIRIPRGSGTRKLRPNPHRPVIHAQNQGVGSCVIYLRQVDLNRSRPWDHSPATVETRQCRMKIYQGESISNVGFVQRGAKLTMVSRDEWMSSIEVRGASFFRLNFPDPNRPLTRALNHEGLVKLQSGTGRFWMRTYLFVSEHPYFVRTDENGEFELSQVPDGTYEVVCWHPNWQIKLRDRHHGTSQVARLFFHDPLIQQREITVKAGEVTKVNFTLTSPPPPDSSKTLSAGKADSPSSP